MTEDDIEKEVGRLAISRAKAKRNISCLDNTLHTLSLKILDLTFYFQTGQREDYAGMQKACKAVEWMKFVETLVRTRRYDTGKVQI